jgi:hypothetical protein
MASRYVEAMLVTNHVLSGAVIGARARGPVRAFALGVASHFALDAVPHWGEWRDEEDFMHIAVRDGLAGMAAMGVLAAITPADKRVAVLAGMAGAAFPDLDKPFKRVFGRSPFPGVVNWFHGAIQTESRDFAPVEAAAAAVFTTAALAVLRQAPLIQRPDPRSRTP